MNNGYPDLGPGGPGHEGRGHLPRSGGISAEALGMTADELRTELEAGKTIAEVASEKGVDVQTVIDAMVADAVAHIDEKVASGDLTAEEGEAKKAELEARITEAVNNGSRPTAPAAPPRLLTQVPAKRAAGESAGGTCAILPATGRPWRSTPQRRCHGSRQRPRFSAPASNSESRIGRVASWRRATRGALRFPAFHVSHVGKPTVAYTPGARACRTCPLITSGATRRTAMRSTGPASAHTSGNTERANERWRASSWRWYRLTSRTNGSVPGCSLARFWKRSGISSPPRMSV